MLWAAILLLIVLIAKYVTSLRIKGIRDRVQGMRPEVEAFKQKLQDIETEREQVTKEEAKFEGSLERLKEIVASLESTLVRGPTRATTEHRDLEDRGS